MRLRLLLVFGFVGVAILPLPALGSDTVGIVAFEEGHADAALADAAQRAALVIAPSVLRSRVAAPLEGMVLEARACRDAACVAALGRTAGHAFLLVLSVHRATPSSAYTVSLRLVDVDSSADAGMAQIEVEPGTTDWTAMLRSSVEALLGQVPPPPVRTGSLLVTANVAGADVFLDGNRVGVTPMELLEDVPAGPHQIRVRADRHSDFLSDVTVPASAEGRVDAVLQPLEVADVPDSRPIYRRPWTWAVAGGAVLTGIIIVAIIVASGGDEALPDPNAIPISHLGR